MVPSPFPYQGPLEPHEVIGRDALLADLAERITARRVTALVGPRRYGKTSVLRRLTSDLTELAAVWVDLYEVTSMADLVFRFDTALSTAPPPFAAPAQSFAASVQVNLGLAKVEFTRPARARPDASARFGQLLEVLVAAARSTPTLLVLDEFSSIATVEGAAGALRTALQHHYSDLGIVFAGSMPSVMRRLFTERPEPFYGQADLVEIGPLSAPTVTELVTERFAATQRGAGVLPGRLVDLTAGHPQRSMQVADAVWRHTPQAAPVDAEIWAAALGEVRAAISEPLERLFSHFQRAERDVLRILANGGSLFGAAASLLELSHGAAQHARNALLADGDLIRRGDRNVITDPLFADWIRRTLPL